MNTEPSSDPMPQPPREPLPEECCGGGCDPCVYDRYSDAMERYRDALQAWQARHPELVPRANSNIP
jgi:hypothetical protein